jgi:hypothetical protein
MGLTTHLSSSAEFKSEWSYVPMPYVPLPLPFSLFKNAFCTSDCVALNDCTVVNRELEQYRRKFSWPYIRHHPKICLDGQRTVGAGQDLKSDTRDCNLEMLPLEPAVLVLCA